MAGLVRGYWSLLVADGLVACVCEGRPNGGRQGTIAWAILKVPKL